MKDCWQPIIPMRWKTQSNGDRVLQQAWAKFAFGDEGWHQTREYRWEDVPVDINDDKYWCKDDS